MQGEKNSMVKVVKHWKWDQKGVGFLSLDPVKTQCVEALSKLIWYHICIYLHSEHWGSTGAPEGPFQPKPFHDEFNCSLLSKPFKTPVQAVRGLFKITWKPPSRDRENPIKKSKSPKSQSCTKLPIYSNTTRFWCFCEQGVWLQTSKCSEQPHIYMDGNSLLSHQPEYRACQEKAPDDCMG